VKYGQRPIIGKPEVEVFDRIKVKDIRKATCCTECTTSVHCAYL